jgi:AraC family transcriptional regulator of adaptative response / DNA-3-methyladenine glycosylase II
VDQKKRYLPAAIPEFGESLNLGPSLIRPQRFKQSYSTFCMHVRKWRVIGSANPYNQVMKLDPDICYQALLTHDTRFDGRFFTGVSTTGIYCRPVCPVKTPRRQSCSFFSSAAAAESAGFRPCLRCRPELAPGNSSVEANARLAHGAASLIEDGLLDGLSVSRLANRLGVTDRHLRRVFKAEFGVSPVRFAQTHRLLLAKRLLTDTALSIIEVAMASGFASLRRFNGLIKERYRMSPTTLRRQGGVGETADTFTLQLGYRPPLDWENLITFLEHRVIEGVESVTDGRYRRSVRMERGGRVHRGWIEVSPGLRRHALVVRVDGALAKVIPQVLAGVKRLFDLSCHPVEIASVLGPLAQERPVLRVPGAFDSFETAVRAILGQQITVKAARTIAGRFAAAFGDPVQTVFPEIHHLFPTHARIAECSVSEIAELGIVSQRARSILSLARAIVSGALHLEPGADVEETVKRLLALPGVGTWTAQYIAMRALAWPDAFPHTDYGVMKAMNETNPARVLAAAEKWRPWRAYAVMHLWASLGGKKG